MKRPAETYQAATFIVRLWREDHSPSAQEAPWRGVAVHVQSGTERGLHAV